MLTRPRYVHVKFQALKLFRSLPEDLLRFPLDVKSVIKTIDNCNISSYEAFSKKFNVSFCEVIQMCSSQTGCTHYQPASGKYLILYNDSFDNYNVEGRQLWTLAHELAHVSLGHLLIRQEASAAENSFNTKVDPAIETEADYFAAQILAPLPLFERLNIKSPIDVQHMFGLSSMASLNQFNKYIKWKNDHVKTSLENDVLKLFTPFLNEF